MEVGDKYVCIKNRMEDILGGALNKKEITYSITRISTSTVSFTCEKNIYNIEAHYSILGDPKRFYTLNDYFVPKNKYRKLKLKKINENKF